MCFFVLNIFVLRNIRPDLETKRQQLIVESAENTKALLDVENNILQILSAPGNILEDENALDVLDNSKVKYFKVKVNNSVCLI